MVRQEVERANSDFTPFTQPAQCVEERARQRGLRVRYGLDPPRTSAGARAYTLRSQNRPRRGGAATRTPITVTERTPTPSRRIRRQESAARMVKVYTRHGDAPGPIEARAAVRGRPRIGGAYCVDESLSYPSPS